MTRTEVSAPRGDAFRRRAAPRLPGSAPVVALAAITLAFFALPFAGLAIRTDWPSLARHLTQPETLDALRLSLITSTSAAAVTLAFGTPLAWVLARVELPGRAVARGLVLLPMVLPPVIGGVALLTALSRRSPIGGWLYNTFGVQFTYSTSGAVIASSFVAMPFYILTVESGLRSLDPRLEQAAAELGAGPVRVFTRVTLPLVAPSLAAGLVLAWARALGEFGATITFAGNVAGRTRTLPLSVFLLLDSDPDTATALCLVLVLVSLAVIITLRHHWMPRG